LYDVQVTSPPACGGVAQVITSAVGIVGVTPECTADFNGDGGVDGSDVEAFFDRWANGC